MDQKALADVASGEVLGLRGEDPAPISRRNIVGGVGLFGAAFAVLGGRAWGQAAVQAGHGDGAPASLPQPDGAHLDPAVRAVKIARAMRAGPPQITRDATITEMDRHGAMTTVLRQGSNDWICTPGDENRIGDPPMCVDRLGMQWFMDVLTGKPRPSITTPGLCYMLCGATQHSNDDPRDTISPAIPIGPHWVVLWPFDAGHSGLPTDVRDAGAWIMFANTPWAYLHVCGSPWSGNGYSPGDEAVWTMQYAKRPA